MKSRFSSDLLTMAIILVVIGAACAALAADFRFSGKVAVLPSVSVSTEGCGELALLTGNLLEDPDIRLAFRGPVDCALGFRLEMRDADGGLLSVTRVSMAGGETLVLDDQGSLLVELGGPEVESLMASAASGGRLALCLNCE